MAVTVANVLPSAYTIDGHLKKAVRDVTMDSTYPTSGESVTAAQLGLDRIQHAEARLRTPAGSVNHVTADASVASAGTSLNILLYDETPAQVANDADVSGSVVRVTAWGT